MRFTCVNRVVSILFLVALICGAGCGGTSHVGWRTDGTGSYPSARPPLEWSNEDNVVWATPMPSWSNSTPIIVGDRLFVCSEPTSLVCLRRSDGAILWERDNSTFELMSPEDADRIRDQIEQAEPHLKELRSVKKRINRLERKLKKDPDDDAMKTELQALKPRRSELDDQLKSIEHHILTGKAHKACGFSTATPVSDGGYVYVMFGNAVTACYDLQGNRQWIKRIDPWVGGHSVSPLLVGDKLLVHAEHLVALNKETGEELWRIAASRRCGTPVHLRVGADDVIATANGEVIRVEDGEKLADGLGGLDYNSPILQNGVLCYSQGDTRAWKIVNGGDGLKPELLWQAKIKNDRYYASPVYHEGLIYSLTRRNVLSVIDANNGELVYEKTLDLGKGDTFPSMSVGGEHVFVSNSNGTTLVLRPGREYDQVAKSELEEFRSSLVFAGSRLYVRGLKHMYCIAASRD